jgi:tRNA(Ile)-lysidine synthase
MVGVTQRVLEHLRKKRLVKAGDRVGVAVSGGPDSVALLRLLLELRGELGIVVAAVLHFNHRLRGKDSDDDEKFVRALAEKHGLDFQRTEADTAATAKKTGEGIEAAARRLRYEFFADALRAKEAAVGKDALLLDVIATGHTLDDQAETVLMRLLRGAGTRGLAAVLPRKYVDALPGSEPASIVRPLLAVRRTDVLAYLRGLGQDFREDATATRSSCATASGSNCCRCWSVTTTRAWRRRWRRRRRSRAPSSSTGAAR